MLVLLFKHPFNFTFDGLPGVNSILRCANEGICRVFAAVTFVTGGGLQFVKQTRKAFRDHGSPWTSRIAAWAIAAATWANGCFTISGPAPSSRR